MNTFALLESDNTQKIKVTLYRILEKYHENFHVFEKVLDKFYPGSKIEARIHFLENRKESVYLKLKEKLTKGVYTFDLPFLVSKLCSENHFYSESSSKYIASLTKELMKVNKELLALETINLHRKKLSLKAVA